MIPKALPRPRNIRRPQRAIALGFSLALLQGCAGSHVSSADAGRFEQAHRTGAFRQAADLASAAGKIGPDGKSEHLVWSLQAGASRLHASEPRSAIAALDNAERLMQAAETDTAKRLGEYGFTTYDGVMVNTYKALAFLAVGDRASARVEFNRVDDRQRRAAERREREIAELRNKVERQRRKEDADYGSALASAMQSREYAANTRALDEFGSYGAFLNPAATFLHGVFLLSAGEGQADFDRAGQSFERVRSMAGNTAVVADAIADAKAARAGRRPAPSTWVVFENGQGATVGQYNITFPVPVRAKGGQTFVSTATVALPRLNRFGPASPAVAVQAGGATRRTEPVGNLDTVVATEFRGRMPGVMAAAVFEAVGKVALQQAVAQTGNRLAMLGAAVASNISTVDTRCWSALPFEFQAARVPAPRDGAIALAIPGGPSLGTVAVPADKPSLVYVKEQAAGGRPAVFVIPL